MVFDMKDIENLSFDDKQVDIIVSNDVLEHVANPSKGFAECARVLKNNGIMIATFPFFSSEDSLSLEQRFQMMA